MKSKSIYIAAHLKKGQLGRARILRNYLEALGYEVTSRWLDKEEHKEPVTFDDYQEIGKFNEPDMARADTIFALLSPDIRGTLVEIGYGFGAGKKVILAGDYTATTPMVHLAGAIFVEYEMDAIKYLEE